MWIIYYMQNISDVPLNQTRVCWMPNLQAEIIPLLSLPALVEICNFYDPFLHPYFYVYLLMSKLLMSIVKPFGNVHVLSPPNIIQLCQQVDLNWIADKFVF